MKSPLKRRIKSTRNSEPSTAHFDELDWTNWWQDHGYIHVRKYNLLEDETWHRVYPREIKGYTCIRVAVYDNILYWLHDEIRNDLLTDHIRKTTKP